MSVIYNIGRQICEGQPFAYLGNIVTAYYRDSELEEKIRAIAQSIWSGVLFTSIAHVWVGSNNTLYYPFLAAGIGVTLAVLALNVAYVGHKIYSSQLNGTFRPRPWPEHQFLHLTHSYLFGTSDPSYMDIVWIHLRSGEPFRSLGKFVGAYIRLADTEQKIIAIAQSLFAGVAFTMLTHLWIGTMHILSYPLSVVCYSSIAMFLKAFNVGNNLFFAHLREIGLDARRELYRSIHQSEQLH